MSFYFSTVDGLLADPLVQMMMRADRVDRAKLERDLIRAASRIGDRPRERAFGFSRARFGTEARPAPLAPPLLPSLRACDNHVCG